METYSPGGSKSVTKVIKSHNIETKTNPNPSPKRSTGHGAMPDPKRPTTREDTGITQRWLWRPLAMAGWGCDY